jgi:transposase
MGKGTKIQDKEKKQIIAYYINGHSMHQCSKKYNRSTSSIKNVVDEAKGSGEQLEQFMNKIEQIKSNHSKEILASISDNVSMEIIDKYKAKLAETKILDGAVVGKYKIQQITAAIGMLYDKGLKVSELALKMREIEKGENTDKLFLNEVEKYSANMIIKEDYTLADENIAPKKEVGNE